MRLKAVDLMVREALPEYAAAVGENWDAKGVEQAMLEVAKKEPFRYAEIVQKLANIGRRAAYFQGETVGLDELDPGVDVEGVLKDMDKEIAALPKSLKPEERAKLRNAIWHKYSGILEKEIMEEAKKRMNTLASAVASGARGKPAQLRAMIGAPGVYADSKGEIIPLYVKNAFSRGIRPADFLAGTYGARSSITSTKRSTAQGGDLLKIANQAAAKLVVTSDDCGTDAGLAIDPMSPQARGRVLAIPTGGFPAGTVIDRKVAKALADKGVKKIVGRSPLTCGNHEGLCAKCIGIRNNGKFAAIGDHVGATASNAIFEPVTQAALSAKHTSGMASGKKSFSGMRYIQQFVQVPDPFQDEAPVAEEESVVEAVEAAPQGGHYVRAGGKQYYVAPSFNVLVKPGDKLNAGQKLSDGLVNPAEIVRLRGIGEGRRYYAKRLGGILADSGLPADSINLEILARGAIDAVEIEDPDDPLYIPGSGRSFSEVQAKYAPPETTKRVKLSDAKGKYLQKPALHFTVGTKIDDRVVEKLSEVGINEVEAAPDPPKWKSFMPRLRESSHDSTDWLAKLSTSYIQKNLIRSAELGEDTNIEQNVHFAPRLAVGENFGAKVRETGKF